MRVLLQMPIVIVCIRPHGYAQHCKMQILISTHAHVSLLPPSFRSTHGLRSVSVALCPPPALAVRAASAVVAKGAGLTEGVVVACLGNGLRGSASLAARACAALAAEQGVLIDRLHALCLLLQVVVNPLRVLRVPLHALRLCRERFGRVADAAPELHHAGQHAGDGHRHAHSNPWRRRGAEAARRGAAQAMGKGQTRSTARAPGAAWERGQGARHESFISRLAHLCQGP
jgi:hypothetical protein